MELELESKQEILLKGFTLLENNLSDEEYRFIMNYNHLIINMMYESIEARQSNIEFGTSDKYGMFKDLIYNFYCCNPFTTLDDELNAYKVAVFCTDFVNRFDSKEELKLLNKLFELLQFGVFNLEEDYEEFLKNPWSVISFNEEDLKFYSKENLVKWGV